MVKLKSSCNNAVDVDVFDQTNNVLVECKRTNTDFTGNLGKIGLKFNSETKLPAIVRDSPGRTLEGVLHVKDVSSFNGLTSRDDVLYRVLTYVQSSNPQSAGRIVGLNRMSKLHVKVGDNIQYTYIRSEW